MKTLPRSKRARATSFFAGSTGEVTTEVVAERLTSRHAVAGKVAGLCRGSHVAASQLGGYCMPAHGVRPEHFFESRIPREAACADPAKRGRYGFDGGCEVLAACPSARDDVNTSGNVTANDNAYALAA